MSQLKRTVARHLEGLTKGGGVRARSGAPRPSLRDDLQTIARGNGFWFSCCFAAALGVFGLAVWFAVVLRDNPAQLTAVSTASGVTIVGALSAMTSLWKQKVRADLLFTLSSQLTPDLMSAVLESVLRDL